MNRPTLPVLPALLAFLLFTGCVKNTGPTASRDPEALIASAQAYFNAQVLPCKPSPASNPRTAAAKTADWSQAQVVQLSSGPAVFVPVHYKNPFPVMTSFSGDRFFDINDQVHLLIYKDSGSVFHARVVSAFPDSGSTAGSGFRGLVLVDNWDGSAVARYRFDGGPVQVYRPVSAPTAQITQNKIAPAIWIQAATTCTIITGVNTVPGDPSATYYWEEEIGCSTDVDSGGDGANLSGGNFTIYPSGRAGGPSGPGQSVKLILPAGNSPIGNITDYVKCFTNNPSTDHTYQVTICVAQPKPGTRSAWGFEGMGSSATGNPSDVGHTFLIFSETYGGSTIIRNIGFYPAGSVNPLFPRDQGMLDDNEGSQYNISLSVTITNSQFFSMLNFASQGNNSGYLYDLNSNNCTSFALNAMAAGNVHLPATIGTWPGGSGNNPGDLGEDLKSMPLSSNMNLNTVYNFHPNTGTCN